MTCRLRRDLYPLEEGLAQHIKSRRKLGLTLTGLVPLNASGSSYQLEKGLRNKSRSCLLSSATETHNTEAFSSVYIRDHTLNFIYPSICSIYGFPVHRSGSCKRRVQTPRHHVYLYSKRPCLLRPVCNTPHRGSD